MLLDEQDGHPAFPRGLPDGGQEPVHHHRRQAEGELIGEQDLRVPAERAAHGQHLLLAAGQVAGSDPQAVCEFREQIQAALPVHSPELQVRRGTEAHEHRPLFGDEGEPVAGAAVQRRLDNVAVQPDLAR